MARLHFSRGLRKALISQSRTTTFTQDLQPGQVVYYFRQSKYNNKTEPSRRKLSLRRCPALLVAFDGQASCFLSHKGQLTKCALEHVRAAPTMEQVAAGVWRDAIEAAIQDITNRGVPGAVAVDGPESGEAPILPTPPLDPPLQPPVRPQELVQALQSSQPAVSVEPSFSFELKKNKFAHYAPAFWCSSWHSNPGFVKVHCSSTAA